MNFLKLKSPVAAKSSVPASKNIMQSSWGNENNFFGRVSLTPSMKWKNHRGLPDY